MTITDYRNFDLFITRAGERCRSFVVDAPAGEASSFGQAIDLVRLQVRLGDLQQHAVESLATAALAALLDVVQGAQHGDDCAADQAPFLRSARRLTGDNRCWHAAGSGNTSAYAGMIKLGSSKHTIARLNC